MRSLSRIILTVAMAISLVMPATPARAKDLIVSAAASLTDAFGDIKTAFEAEHPGVNVVMNFAASGALFRQMAQGAPVDVFASADHKWMERAVDEGFVNRDAVAVFVRNDLVLAVPADNPAKITELGDLTGDRVGTIGLATPVTSPAGQYTRTALSEAGLYHALAPKLIFGETVRQILDYIARDEVDCGFVFRTDAVKAGKAVLVVQEIALEEPITYPIAAVSESRDPAMAQAFVAFVTSSAGAALLEAHGFARP
ncbi:molybdate ABC transporter substrate-binding protein [Pseudodesulfovibrio pelocollis]|uniref:molybdate ABC transporter substrate-binding protein n=1 Tax=Pseudodesulfovibrio pelocollis TaxID=3051432 RepID=UPI00255AC3D7|nr:molybdate ABC transporter substrate-binding protein [Pseudodesulfovibrio sp. SB368]